MRCREILALATLSIVLVAGCNPVTTGIKLGAKVVGDVVDDSETQKLGQQLVGQPPSAADQLLGQRANVLRQVNGNGLWLVYPVKMDLARSLYYYEKVKGKTPADAQTSLGLGPPQLVVVSETTGQMSQLYNASMMEGITGQVYCILRFDGGVCTKVDMVKVAATSGQQ
jgi:hypothetical protein